MPYESLIIWSLLGVGALCLTGLCFSFSRLLNLLFTPEVKLPEKKVIVVSSETVSNVGRVRDME